MKKFQIGLAALLLSVSFAMAQQPATKSHDKFPGRQHKEMGFQQLNLSEEQKAQMKTINEDFKKQMRAISSNENQTVKQQRDQRTALMQSHKAKIESILTADQKAQLATLQADRKKDFKEMSAKRLNKMKTELSLTDKQVSQLQSNQEAFKGKLEAIRNNNSLDRTAKMTQLKALHDEMNTSFESVLTPEQKIKWQGMKKDRMHHKKGNFQKGKTPPAA